MPELHTKLSEEKLKEIESFLMIRFRALEDMRTVIDQEVEREVAMYDNIDERIDKKQEWEEKIKMPYIYTIVQTMVARITQTLFPYQNYVKAYSEEEQFYEVEQNISQWIQDELDRIRFHSRARDFIEEALKKRVSWLQLIPIKVPVQDSEGNEIEGFRISFDVYDWYDVWFDTKAREVKDTDFFVRKIKKLYKVKQNKEFYFNLDRVQKRVNSSLHDDNGDSRNKEYEAKHSGGDTRPSYVSDDNNYNPIDEVELYEYYGVIDLGDGDVNDPEYVPDMKEVICTLANKTTLIRISENTIPTERKRLMFPIRPLRQSNSLIGKSVPQLTKDLAHELNESRSLRMQNFKLLIKLLFKVDKNADIDFGELFAQGGNAISYDGDPKSLDIFQIPNLVGLATGMGQDIIRDMQQITGAVDPVQGISGGGGNDTASGIRTVTEQALFKFSMMAENVYDDILEFINFVAILNIKHNRAVLDVKYPKLVSYFDRLSDLVETEQGYVVDIALKDLSQRRDVEMNQWANAMSIITPLLQQAGGNTTMLLRQFMEVFQMRSIDKLLTPESPDQIAMKLMNNPQLAQSVMAMIAQMQAQNTQSQEQQLNQAAAVPGGDTIERAGNENVG